MLQLVTALGLGLVLGTGKGLGLRTVLKLGAQWELAVETELL